MKEYRLTVYLQLLITVLFLFPNLYPMTVRAASPSTDELETRMSDYEVFFSSLSGVKNQNNKRTSILKRQIIKIFWKFNVVEVDSEPFTIISLVIQSKPKQVIKIGKFYGRVQRVISQLNDEQNWLPKSALLCCITFHAGTGYEIYVFLAKKRHQLYIKCKRVSEEGSPSKLRTIKKIKISEHAIIKPVG